MIFHLEGASHTHSKLDLEFKQRKSLKTQLLAGANLGIFKKGGKILYYTYHQIVVMGKLGNFNNVIVCYEYSNL